MILFSVSWHNYKIKPPKLYHVDFTTINIRLALCLNFITNLLAYTCRKHFSGNVQLYYTAQVKRSEVQWESLANFVYSVTSQSHVHAISRIMDSTTYLYGWKFWCNQKASYIYDNPVFTKIQNTLKCPKSLCWIHLDTEFLSNYSMPTLNSWTKTIVVLYPKCGWISSSTIHFHTDIFHKYASIMAGGDRRGSSSHP